jgi:hypothetical protein
LNILALGRASQFLSERLPILRLGYDVLGNWEIVYLVGLETHQPFFTLTIEEEDLRISKKALFFDDGLSCCGGRGATLPSG